MKQLEVRLDELDASAAIVVGGTVRHQSDERKIL